MRFYQIVQELYPKNFGPVTVLASGVLHNIDRDGGYSEMQWRMLQPRNWWSYSRFGGNFGESKSLGDWEFFSHACIKNERLIYFWHLAWCCARNNSFFLCSAFWTTLITMALYISDHRSPNITRSFYPISWYSCFLEYKSTLDNSKPSEIDSPCPQQHAHMHGSQ